MIYQLTLTFDNQAHESSATKPRLYWKHHSAVIENRPNRQQRTVQPSANTVNPENQRARTQSGVGLILPGTSMSWIAKNKCMLPEPFRSGKHCVYQHKRTCGFLWSQTVALTLCDSKSWCTYPKEEFCFLKSIPAQYNRTSLCYCRRLLRVFRESLYSILALFLVAIKVDRFHKPHTFRALEN